MAKLEIINRALLKLGEPPIASLNDTAFGKSYEMIYDDVKKLLLSAYPWRFAIALQPLAQQQDKFGVRYLYTLPEDCLLLLRVFDSASESLLVGYEMAGQAIALANQADVSAEYVKNIEDDVLFSALFREALAAKIAAELAMRLKHSINFKQVFENEFYNLILQAELNNEIAKCAETMPDNSWVQARLEY